ncbi:MAG: hypothetical protein U9N59_14360 [Campylobacterota bacterium]|nr:hypothetical protein [Campylobacterota bacterium]
MIENQNLTTMIDIFCADETILINSDIDTWSQTFDEDMIVHFVNTNKKVIKSIDDISFDSINWTEYSDMINSSSSISSYNTYSNPSLDGQVDNSVVSHLWSNVKKLNSKDIDTISLDKFISSNCSVESTKMLLIDSLDGSSIVADIDIKVLGVDIVSIRLIDTDDQSLAALSKSTFDSKMRSLGYKVISSKQEYHPDRYTVVYLYDYKRNSIDSKKTLQDLSTQNKNFTSKIDDLQNDITKEISDKQSKIQEIETQKAEKQNIQKELDKPKIEIENYKSSKEKELLVLKSELETKIKRLQETQLNSEQLQKQKTELNTKVETLQNEKQSLEEKLKDFTELENNTKTLEESLRQSRSEKDTIQKELDKLKAELANKTEELTTAKQTKEQEIVKLKRELETKNKELKEKNDIVNSLIASNKTILTSEYLATLGMQEKVKAIVSHTMKQEDILESIDFYVLGNELNNNEKFDVCCEFAEQIAKSGDRMQGVGFVNNGKLFLAHDEKLQKEQYKKLINLATSLNQLNIAVDFEMEYNANYGIFEDSVNKKLFEEYKKIRNASHKKQQHGQDLLIDYINENIKDGEGKGKVMVEVGTTRENVPGQGSTLQLATLCKQKGIKFITVDMDAHNTRWANFISNKYDLNIEAVTRKGEDFLKNDIDSFDFVFLDAYDFDHGNHSELRQSRYEKYLGSKIDEKKAHRMHLKCAKSVVKKLKKDGVVCVDDTWQDEAGEWSAKGTLAVPYLIDKKFNIIDDRNRGVLMARKAIIES